MPSLPSWPTSAVERLARRALLLPSRPENYLTAGLRTEPVAGGSRLVFLDEESYAQETLAELEEGWRGELADRVARAPFIARQELAGLQRRARTIVQGSDAEYVLGLRELVFKSWHVHLTGDTVEVEGWLTAAEEDPSRGLGVTVVAARGLQEAAEYEWSTGDVLPDGGVRMSGQVNLVVPHDTLTGELLLEALSAGGWRRWSTVRGTGR